jgi:hypothetical protein
MSIGEDKEACPLLVNSIDQKPDRDRVVFFSLFFVGLVRPIGDAQRRNSLIGREECVRFSRVRSVSVSSSVSLSLPVSLSLSLSVCLLIRCVTALCQLFSIWPSYRYIHLHRLNCVIHVILLATTTHLRVNVSHLFDIVGRAGQVDLSTRWRTRRLVQWNISDPHGFDIVTFRLFSGTSLQIVDSIRLRTRTDTSVRVRLRFLRRHVAIRW